MRRHKRLMLATVSLLVIVGVAGIVFAQARNERPDCSGKITCSLTGELICRDQCPTVDRNRPDCPGRIICPLTGKPVCKDRCPLGNKAAKNADTDALPPCCRKG